MSKQKRFSVVTAVGLGMLVCASPAMATVTVSLRLPLTSPNVGELFDVRIVADLPNAVVGWGLDFSIADQLVATITNVSIGSAWISASTVDGDGLAGVAFPNSVAGTEVLLATVTLQALAQGTTQLTPSDDHPADLTEGFALDPTGFDSVIYQPASLSVVPEPTSLLLFGALAIALSRRRRSAIQS